MVVCLCVSYTFVQGGHVRVDLVYSAVKHRTKRIIDMFGCLFFMMPAIVITYLYAWFFMWRHLMTPSVTSTSDLDRMLMQARIFRWNVETIGFSPNGFNAYFLFKVLIVLFCVLVFLQAVAFFWRSYLEWVEGEESAGKYLDRDGWATRPKTSNTHPFGLDLSGQTKGRDDADRARIEGKDETCFSDWMGSRSA
jgi:TRAP-type C4-dicarboxylate transport system permease small subunit